MRAVCETVNFGLIAYHDGTYLSIKKNAWFWSIFFNLVFGSFASSPNPKSYSYFLNLSLIKF